MMLQQMGVYSSTFQFHKGTIRTPTHHGSNAQYLNFNSIKVQLEQAEEYLCHNLDLYFNSIKVQLEPIKRLMLYIAIVNFNSIKVQLEREAAQGIALLCHYFNSIKVQLEP